jgi:hypothetical protein
MTLSFSPSSKLVAALRTRRPSLRGLLVTALASVLTETSLASVAVTRMSPRIEMIFIVPGLDGSENFIVVVFSSAARRLAVKLTSKAVATRNVEQVRAVFILGRCMEG